eukprot:Pgem_evm1s16459
MLCNNAQLCENGVLGQPTEGALLVAAAKGGLVDERRNSVRTKEVPFSSQQKWMSVSYEQNGEEIVYAKGIVEAILSM